MCCRKNRVYANAYNHGANLLPYNQQLTKEGHYAVYEPPQTRARGRCCGRRQRPRRVGLVALVIDLIREHRATRAVPMADRDANMGSGGMPASPQGERDEPEKDGKEEMVKGYESDEGQHRTELGVNAITALEVPPSYEIAVKSA